MNCVRRNITEEQWNLWFCFGIFVWFLFGVCFTMFFVSIYAIQASPLWFILAALFGAGMIAFGIVSILLFCLSCGISQPCCCIIDNETQRLQPEVKEQETKDVVIQISSDSRAVN